MTAIVTCGETRQSLTATRALGRRSIPVAVGATIRPCLATWSRFATSAFITHNPKLKPFLFVQQLSEELVARYATCALVSTDAAFWALSAYRQYLPISARRILPPHYSVVRSLDLEALHHFAESLGIACAPLIRLSAGSTPAQIHELANDIFFPFLLRPAISWTEREGGTPVSIKPVVVKSLKKLQSLLSGEGPWAEQDCLMSAYRAQRALAYFGVAKKGEVLVEGFQERLSELEPFSEISTKSITISPIEELQKSSKTLLNALSWEGPFKMEFIQNEQGQFQLLSLIGRLWGSLQLSVASGMNIPLICYRLAEGTLTQDILCHAKPNVRMRWLIGDASSKVANTSRLFGDLAEFSKNFSPKSLLSKREPITTCYDVLDFNDPMPFLFELQHRTWRQAFGERA